jgi:hypothetical protein
VQIQNNMEKKRVSASSSEIAELADKQSKLDALHAKAMTMFTQLDTDGNGVIDRCAAARNGVFVYAALCCCDGTGRRGGCCP